MKAIKQYQTRNIIDAYNKEDISYSRMNEMFNEIADEYAIEFAEWLLKTSVLKTDIPMSVKLKMFKNQKGL